MGLWTWVVGVFAATFAASSILAQDVAPPDPDNEIALRVPAPAAPRVTRPHPPVWSASRFVEIPAAAKARGENGYATFEVTVGEDGKAIAIELTRSSGSAALDQAAREKIEANRFLMFRPLGDQPVPNRATVSLHYGKWSNEDPAGGIETYTCLDLALEYTFFEQARNGGPGLFRLQNYVESTPNLIRLTDGQTPDREAFRAGRAAGQDAWREVLRKCSERPKALFLDQVDEPDFIRDLLVR